MDEGGQQKLDEWRQEVRDFMAAARERLDTIRERCAAPADRGSPVAEDTDVVGKFDSLTASPPEDSDERQTEACNSGFTPPQQESDRIQLLKQKLAARLRQSSESGSCAAESS